MAGKSDIVDSIANSAGVTKQQATDAFEAVFSSIADALENGERVQIPGFGSFSISERAAREGRNPATGATIQIAASKAARFKQGTALKARLNN